MPFFRAHWSHHSTKMSAKLLLKEELSSFDRFKLLVLGVPIKKAIAQPPINPSKSVNILVDKEAAARKESIVF